MSKFKVGEYDIRYKAEKGKLEIQNGTYKYVDLTFEELEQIYKKIIELRE